MTIPVEVLEAEVPSLPAPLRSRDPSLAPRRQRMRAIDDAGIDRGAISVSVSADVTSVHGKVPVAVA